MAKPWGINVIVRYYAGPRVVCPFCEEAGRAYNKPRTYQRRGKKRWHRCTHPDCGQPFVSVAVPGEPKGEIK